MSWVSGVSERGIKILGGMDHSEKVSLVQLCQRDWSKCEKGQSVYLDLVFILLQGGGIKSPTTWGKKRPGFRDHDGRLLPADRRLFYFQQAR